MLEHFGKVINKLGDVEIRLNSMETRLGSIETRVGSIESRIGSIESRLTKVEFELSEIKQSQTTLENKFEKKLDALYYDWRNTQKQLNEEMATDIKILDTKVEALQMESNKYDQEIKDLTEAKFYLVKAPKE